MSTFNDTQNQILPYKECKDIYRTTTLGKRIVEGLPNFAMSTQREIDIHKAPPEAIEKFKETAAEMKQDEAIKKTIYNARIYGTGGLYIAMYDEEKEEDDFTTKPTFEDAYKYKIKFNILDPLNISGSRVDIDPLSFHFLEVVDIQVNSKTIPKKRIAISHALEPLYLDTRTSLIPYSPPSVFYNMVELLKQYDDAVKSIGDLLYKAGAIIYKYPVKSKLTGVTLDAITASGNILEQKRSGEVISISNDSTVEDFPIANLNGLIDSINKLEDDITKALSDTPVSILFDRNLSNGFSEGDKDKETVISTIESFRENKLTPLYNLTDYYIMLKAWDRAFIDEMRYKYSEYKDKTDNEIFRSWAENFKFKYGNLFPEPESVIQDNNAKKLDNLLKAQQLGANPADLQEELNESEIFKNEMELNPQNMEVNEDDKDMFDYNNINSEIKVYSDNNFKEEEHPRDEDGKFAKGTQSEKESEESRKGLNNIDNSSISYNNVSKELSNIQEWSDKNKKQEEILTQIRNRLKSKAKEANYYKENINKLPDNIKSAGEKLYSYKYKGGEFIYSNDNKKIGDVDNNKMKQLSPIEKSIYDYTSENKYFENETETLELIRNAPAPDCPLYRGENKGRAVYEFINNIKVGDKIPFNKNIKSFTSSYLEAEDFADINNELGDSKNQIIWILEKPGPALNIDALSYYRGKENEYLVENNFIIDKIEEKNGIRYINISVNKNGEK